jgi:hypothetical protein
MSPSVFDTIRLTIVDACSQSLSDGSSGVANVANASPLLGTVRYTGKRNPASLKCHSNIVGDCIERLPDHLALCVDVIIVLVVNGIHDGVLLGVEVFIWFFAVWCGLKRPQEGELRSSFPAMR